MSVEKDPLNPWWSAWFITINTNSANRGFINPLRAVWSYVIENIEMFTDGTLDVEQRWLVVPENNMTVEIGPKYHRIHMHATLVFRTTGLVNLSYSRVREFFQQQLSRIPGFKNVHFNAQLIKNYNAMQLIADYMGDSVTSRKNADFQVITEKTERERRARQHQERRRLAEEAEERQARREHQERLEERERQIEERERRLGEEEELQARYRRLASRQEREAQLEEQRREVARGKRRITGKKAKRKRVSFATRRTIRRTEPDEGDEDNE